MKVNAFNLTLKLLIKLEIIMKQTFLRLDTLIEVSWSGQKIKCPRDVSTEIVAFFEEKSFNISNFGNNSGNERNIGFKITYYRSIECNKNVLNILFISVQTCLFSFINFSSFVFWHNFSSFPVDEI